MKALAILAGAVLVVIGVGVGAEALSTSTSTPPRLGRAQPATPAELPHLAALRKVAEQTVRLNGDAGLHDGWLVLTTRQQAAGGEVVNSDQPVYELILLGTFVCALCSRPATAPPPSGDVITVSIDRATLETTDFGIGDTLPPVPRDLVVYSFTF